NRYTNRYYAAMLVFPIVTVAVYAVLARVARFGTAHTEPPHLEIEAPVALDDPRRRWTAAAVLTGLVAAGFGLEAMGVLGEHVSRPVLLVGVGALFVGLVASIARLGVGPPRATTARSRIAVANAL